MQVSESNRDDSFERLCGKYLEKMSALQNYTRRRAIVTVKINKMTVNKLEWLRQIK
jgi:hypothetical protein